MHATDLGVDPRTLPMVAFGGAGPVHAYGIARKLGIKRVICPTGAGVTSAIGLLDRAGRGRPLGKLPDGGRQLGFRAMRRLLDDLAAQGARSCRAAGVAEDAITNRYTVDMRHVGQGHEITVALPDRDLPRTSFSRRLLRELLPSSTASCLAVPLRARRSKSSLGACVPAAARTE